MAVAVGEPAAAVVGSSRGGLEIKESQNPGNNAAGEQKLAAKEESVWNTKRLGSRMVVDAASAMTAGGLVAPIITMIDK